MNTLRALAAWILVLLTAAPAGAAEPERTPADELRSVAEVQSLILLRGGSTALEWYRAPADAGPTNIKSASKSVLSALVGIALDRGLVADLDTPVAELIPAQADLLEAPAKRGITLRHLLSMTAGLESTSQEAYGAWVSGSNWVRGALSRPLVSKPGEDFIYSTGSSHVVAAILDRAAAPIGLARWARLELFGPAGIGHVTWQRSPEGVPLGGNNMAMAPRDLARFGRLWLAGHPPGGDPILTASWIETATGRQAEGWPDRYGAYGLGWWLPGGGSFLAVGFGGQFVWVDPAHDSVVVVTSDDTQKPLVWDRRVLELVRRVAADD